MKKLILLVLLSVSILAFPLITGAFAVEASLGVSTWYAWWKFNDNDGMEVDPAPAFGPVFSLRFSDSWSLAGVFLYGRFKNNDNGDGPSSHISRYDSDVSLNYNINRYFKVFAGGKYMAFTWEQSNGDGIHWSAGPGLGIGSTLPLTESLYLLLNISSTYSFGRHDSPPESNDRDSSSDITEISFNTSAAFAYYIKSASTSINLGFRYQLVKTDYKDNTNSKDESFSFYGPTLSAVYSF